MVNPWDDNSQHRTEPSPRIAQEWELNDETCLAIRSSEKDADASTAARDPQHSIEPDSLRPQLKPSPEEMVEELKIDPV